MKFFLAMASMVLISTLGVAHSFTNTESRVSVENDCRTQNSYLDREVEKASRDEKSSAVISEAAQISDTVSRMNESCIQRISSSTVDKVTMLLGDKNDAARDYAAIALGNMRARAYGALPALDAALRRANESHNGASTQVGSLHVVLGPDSGSRLSIPMAIRKIKAAHDADSSAEFAATNCSSNEVQRNSSIAMVALNTIQPFVTESFARKMSLLILEDRYPSNFFLPKGKGVIIDGGEVWRITFDNGLVNESDDQKIAMSDGVIVPRALTFVIRKSNAEVVDIQ